MVGGRSMEIGITVDVLFDLAHFRVHTTMKSRTSYLIPLHTTVIGFFFSILGKTRDEYIKERKKYRAGAKLLKIGGICREYVQLLKLKRGREERPAEELMVLFKPKYRFAIWGNEKTVRELYRRITEFDFEFVPYGGISEFIFNDIKRVEMYDKPVKTNMVEDTYVPKHLFSSLEMGEDGIVYSLPYIYNGSPKTVIMGYNVKFKLKNEIWTIGGVPLYDCFLECEHFS